MEKAELLNLILNENDNEKIENAWESLQKYDDLGIYKSDDEIRESLKLIKVVETGMDYGYTVKFGELMSLYVKQNVLNFVMIILFLFSGILTIKSSPYMSSLNFLVVAIEIMIIVLRLGSIHKAVDSGERVYSHIPYIYIYNGNIIKLVKSDRDYNGDTCIVKLLAMLEIMRLRNIVDKVDDCLYEELKWLYAQMVKTKQNTDEFDTYASAVEYFKQLI